MSRQKVSDLVNLCQDCIGEGHKIAAHVSFDGASVYHHDEEGVTRFFVGIGKAHQNSFEEVEEYLQGLLQPENEEGEAA